MRRNPNTDIKLLFHSEFVINSRAIKLWQMHLFNPPLWINSLIYFHLLTSNFYNLEVVLEWFCKQKQIVTLNKTIFVVSIYQFIAWLITHNNGRMFKLQKMLLWGFYWFVNQNDWAIFCNPRTTNWSSLQNIFRLLLI